MVVCRYYQAGRCRYGNNCRFEHIDPPGGFGSNDPFSTSGKPNNRFGGNRTDEQPQWPLSAVGKDDAEQGNEVSGDLSPEELRVLAYSMAPRGMSAEVTQREGQLVAEHQAKLGNMAQDGMHTGGPSTANDAFQTNDPFSQNPNSASQTGSGFRGGFGQGGMNGGNQQQGFGQSQQRQQSQNNPFGSSMPQGGNAFGQSQQFIQSAPQQDMPVQAAAPLANSNHDSQFSAAQFGFAKVPEAAPPPQYY